LNKNDLIYNHRPKNCNDCVKVLIVDDNEFNTMSLLDVMEEFYSLKCETASNGKEAVEIVEGRKCCAFKLIFMDCMMPLMDGF
jgi:CheY-like chemotaxis protein